MHPLIRTERQVAIDSPKPQQYNPDRAVLMTPKNRDQDQALLSQGGLNLDRIDFSDSQAKI